MPAESPLLPHLSARGQIKRWGKEALRGAFELLNLPMFSRPALHSLDRKLEKALPHRGGWFVEAGANDGFQQSNTYYLAKFKDWKGVLIEPVPELAAACRIRRPESQVFECALGTPEQSGTTLPLRYAGLMTQLCGALGDEVFEKERAKHGLQIQGMAPRETLVNASVRTLTEVLEESQIPRKFDLLSLDVEGYELQVLQGLDFKKFLPRAICMEVRTGNLKEVQRTLGCLYQEPVLLHAAGDYDDYLFLSAG